MSALAFIPVHSLSSQRASALRRLLVHWDNRECTQRHHSALSNIPVHLQVHWNVIPVQSLSQCTRECTEMTASALLSQCTISHLSALPIVLSALTLVPHREYTEMSAGISVHSLSLAGISVHSVPLSALRRLLVHLSALPTSQCTPC